MRYATWRPELEVDATPPPQRIAPYASAISCDIVVADEELGSGRFVLLHDPQGNPAWGGTFRCVTYVRADIESELAADPLLTQVGWSWFEDALASHGAEYEAPSGTVTSVASESFGGLAEEPPTAEVEIRASWTPLLVDGEGLDNHLQAWGDLACHVAGLPPLPSGVVPLQARRARR